MPNRAFHPSKSAALEVHGVEKIGLLLSGVTSKDGIQAQDKPPAQEKTAA